MYILKFKPISICVSYRDDGLSAPGPCNTIRVLKRLAQRLDISD